MGRVEGLVESCITAYRNCNYTKRVEADTTGPRTRLGGKWTWRRFLKIRSMDHGERPGRCVYSPTMKPSLLHRALVICQSRVNEPWSPPLYMKVSLLPAMYEETSSNI